MKVEVDILDSPSLIVFMVSVDVKDKERAHELNERRGGRPGLPVPNSPYGLVDVK